MYPSRTTVPFVGLQCGIPNTPRKASIDLIFQLGDRGASHGVVHCQSRGSLRSWAVSGIDSTKGNDEPGNVDSCLFEIVYGRNRRVFPIQPTVNGPVPWISLTSGALCNRRWDGQRQMTRDQGKPTLLLLNCVDRPMNPRETDDHIRPQSVESIVGPCSFNSLDG